MGHILLNNVSLINWKKRFDLKYKTNILRNFLLLPWPRFTGFLDPHLPVAFLKSTYEDVWKYCGPNILETSVTRFRQANNVSQCLMCYWQLVTGNFYPTDVMKTGKYIRISDETVKEIMEMIIKKKQRILVLNDGPVSNFNEVRREIASAFEKILSGKSSFEK